MHRKWKSCEALDNRWSPLNKKHLMPRTAKKETFEKGLVREASLSSRFEVYHHIAGCQQLQSCWNGWNWKTVAWEMCGCVEKKYKWKVEGKKLALMSQGLAVRYSS
jgi:hypothetical protein